MVSVVCTEEISLIIFGAVKQNPEISQCSQVTSEAAVTLRESSRFPLAADPALRPLAFSIVLTDREPGTG